MPTFPITSSRDLGLGQTGGGTQAPALVQGVGLVEDVNDVPSGAVWLYPYSAADPTTLTGQVPSGLIFGLGSYAGNVYVVNDAGVPVKFLDNGALAGTITVDSLDLGDNDPINFGDADDIVMKWNGTAFAVTQATPNSQILLGVSGAGIDLQCYGDTAGRDMIWDQSADSLIFGDSAKVVFGTGSDMTFLWDGTDLLVSQALADSTVKWGVSGAGINHVWYGDTANQDLVWDQTNNQLRFDDNTVLGIGTGGGALSDIQMSWNGTKMLVAQLTANSAIDFGVDGAGIDLVMYGDTAGRSATWDQSLDSLILADNTTLGIGSGAGAGADITLAWDASKLVVAQLTANSAVDWGIDGAGLDQNWYGDTASAKLMWDQSQDALIRSGAAVDLYTQAGGTTGVVFEVIGVDLTHGVKRTCYSATVNPAAIETALFTIPAQSVVESVQASVVTALTGGGTTVTFSVGVTGDVDLYGTATNAGVQADLLTQNAKLDCFGRRAANAGAGIGLYSAATQDLKLIGAATGGASAGDTALTVGSVKIRVVYATMMSLADGA